MLQCSSLCQALKDAPPPPAGTYTLLLWLANNQPIKIGRLGCFEFPKGYYTYTGSAKRGLMSRLHRHIHGAVKQHWHIDYLRPFVQVLDWQAYAEGMQPECNLNERLMRWGEVVAHRFGSSDCRCLSHLLHADGNRRPAWRVGL
ncbi:MAG: GIY-YIG nuclease family protein [bacterium]|nr:GIY-YIG nuclease family protein [bacterium]